LQDWATRWFKPLGEEEVTVAVNPESGVVTGFAHTVPEDRAGADLPVEQARGTAEKFAATRGWNVESMDLKESSSEKKKARRESSVEWEGRPGGAGKVEGSKFRVAVEVSGDQVTEARAFWKTPEWFDRARERNNAISIAVRLARIAAAAGLIVFALWLLIHGAREGMIRWRAAIALAIPAALAAPV